MTTPKTTSSKETITSYQAYAVTLSTMIGVSVLSLPRDVSARSGTDGVFIILISGLFTWIILFGITKLSQRFPKQTIVDYIPQILGSERNKWVGKILGAPFLILIGVYWIAAIAAVSRVFVEAIAVSILPKTPPEAILITLIAVSAMGASCTPVIIARLNEILLPLVLIPILFLMVGMILYGQLELLLPFYPIDWKTIIKTVLTTAFAFAGYEISLIFSGYYEKPDQALKIHTIAIISITLMYCLDFASSLSVFGLEELQNIMWPIIEFIKVIVNPKLFINRLEAVILSIWVATVFVSMTNIYASLVYIVKNFVKTKSKLHKWIPWIFAPIIFGAALYPGNVKEVFVYVGWIGVLSLIVSFIIPFTLLLVAIIRKKRGNQPNETTSST